MSAGDWDPNKPRPFAHLTAPVNEDIFMGAAAAVHGDFQIFVPNFNSKPALTITREGKLIIHDPVAGAEALMAEWQKLGGKI